MVPVSGSHEEVVNNWKQTEGRENVEEHSIPKKGEIIQNFWKKREETLKTKIEKIKDKFLTLASWLKN